VGVMGDVKEETFLPSAEFEPCFHPVVQFGVMEMLLTARERGLSPYSHRPTGVINDEICFGTRINYLSNAVISTASAVQNTWVISKVLHTVCFLFKNEIILQNTFTCLQCNLHCALSQRSNVWETLVFLS
jgi:hypothetical protein